MYWNLKDYQGSVAKIRFLGSNLQFSSLKIKIRTVLFLFVFIKKVMGFYNHKIHQIEKKDIQIIQENSGEQ